MPVMCKEQPLNTHTHTGVHTHAHTRVHNVIDEQQWTEAFPSPLLSPPGSVLGLRSLGLLLTQHLPCARWAALQGWFLCSDSAHESMAEDLGTSRPGTEKDLVGPMPHEGPSLSLWLKTHMS